MNRFLVRKYDGTECWMWEHELDLRTVQYLIAIEFVGMEYRA